MEFSAVVRAGLGLSGRQLGRYLGVSVGFVAQVEAGHKPLPLALVPRLLHLLPALPPPLGQGPVPPPAPVPYNVLLPLPAPEPLVPPPPTPPDAGVLAARGRSVRLRLLRQGTALAAAQARAAALHQRRLALAHLLALPPPPEAAEAAHLARWLRGLTTDLTRDDPAPAARAAALRLLAARVAGLRAELAALAP
ncbi:hypothetical protein D0T11_03695 [Hymenobacter rubripertinctus]|uniref:Uncharacterized protein n=1 Tax=Hymenobacter rubripertinctus TaxID=2029981 RepID=A0A418R5U1_9BACT|nr:hypothetical protein D0T11_03695 [Hymenobacter rubripertinctus]